MVSWVVDQRGRRFGGEFWLARGRRILEKTGVRTCRWACCPTLLSVDGHAVLFCRLNIIRCDSRVRILGKSHPSLYIITSTDIRR